MTALAMVAAARSLLGSPYHPRGRLPGIAIDCIGVPIVSAWIAGLKPRTFDFRAYGMTPDGTLLPHCDMHMVRIERADMRPGDMIVAAYGSQPHHVGVLGDYRHGGLSMIHADAYRHKAVIEHRLWLDGAMKFVAAYRLPELAS